MKDSIRKKRHSDDPRSLLSSYSVKPTVKPKISQIQLRKDNFESLMENAKDIIDQLFLPNDIRSEVGRSFNTCHHLGQILSSQSDPDSSQFFSSWLKTASILSNYYKIPTSQRLKLFLDDSIKIISKSVEPLNNFNKNVRDVFTQMKIEKYKISFQSQMDNLVGISNQYAKGQISFEIISKSVRQLLNDITRLENSYFHQNRNETADVLSKVQVILTQIQNSIYDHSNKDSSVIKCMNSLNSITEELKSLFESSTTRTQSTKTKPKKDEIRINAIPTTKKDLVQKVEENDVVEKKVVPLRRRSGESIELLEEEIDDLSNEIDAVNEEILKLEESMNKKSKLVNHPLEHHRKLLEERILIETQLTKEFRDQIDSWISYNDRLVNKTIDEMEINRINQQIEAEISDLNQQLSEMQSTLNKHAARRESMELDSNERSLVYHLQVHNQILQANLQEIKQNEDFLITDIDQLYGKRSTSSQDDKTMSTIFIKQLDDKRNALNQLLISSVKLLSELRLEMRNTTEAESALNALKESHPDRNLTDELYEKARKEKCDKYFYQNEIDMMDRWIRKVCPKIKPNLSIEKKLNQLKKIINSLTVFSS